MINRYATALTLTAISILFSSVAFADDPAPSDTTTTTANMQVTLTVEKSCQFGVDDMDFGSHASSENKSITVSADASVTCTNGTAYSLSSEAGHTYAMSSNGGMDTVAYTLYSDAAGTSDLSATAIPGTGTGSVQEIPIYGKVTAGALAKAPAGDYTDTVTLTVTY